jgi:hypothetical protein
MLGSLGLAALAAVAVVITTTSVVVLTRESADQAKRELEAYKIDAGVRIAQAEKSAGEANQKAESEKLERLKLEAAVAPRRLSLDDQRSCSLSLKAFTGERVVVSSYTLDSEAMGLAGQLISALNNAGIIAIDARSTLTPTGTIDFGIRINGNGPLVSAIKSALPSVLFENNSSVSLAGGVGGGSIRMGSGPSPMAHTSSARILVGVKPIVLAK